MAEAKGSSSVFREIGNSGLAAQQGQYLQEEFLPELIGNQGVRAYYEMSRSPVLGCILFVLKQMITQVDWKINPFTDEGGGEASAADDEAKLFVEQCKDDMSSSFADFLSEVCSMFTYGWAFMEIVYKLRDGRASDPISKYDDGKFGWRKISLRGQNTLEGWDFDSNGGLKGMVQRLSFPTVTTVTIPIEKALLFRTDVEKNNPEGKSVLRNAYRPWWYAKRFEEIEAIGIERDLAGLPVLTVPKDLDIWNPNDPDMVIALRSAKNLVVSLRRGEREGVVLPDGWVLTLLGSSSRRQFDVNQTITRHETRAAMSVLADFIFLGQGKTGSWALSSDKTDLFLLALKGFLVTIKEVFNRHAIPRLLELNGMDITRAPTLDHGDLETQNLSELAQYLSAMSTAGAVMFPDEALERHLRLIAGFPPPPELTDEEKEQREIMLNAPPTIPEIPDPNNPEVKEAIKKIMQLRRMMKDTNGAGIL